MNDPTTHDPRQLADIADGIACVICGLGFISSSYGEVPHVPVGRDVETGSQVFACAECCDEDARLIDSLAHGDQLPPGSDRVAELLAAWRDEVRAEPLPPLPTIPHQRRGDDR